MLKDSTIPSDKNTIGSWPSEDNKRKVIKTKPNALIIQEDRDLKKILSEKALPITNDVMRGESYKAPQFHEPRPGAMNFMKVASIGYRC